MIHTIYTSFPTVYTDTLRNKGHRGKARAFWEYHYDMEKGEHNAVRFYAKSWGVSTSTSHAWIEDFKQQIDLYHDAWILKNKQHYSSVKKQTEHSEHFEPNTNSTYKAKEIGTIEDTTEHSEQEHPNEALNLNNNNAGDKTFWGDKEFNDLFFIYGANTKYKGKKDEAYEVFKLIDTNVDLLKLASIKYLHDPETDGKRYNLTNFLKHQIYLSYLPKQMKLVLEGVERIGTYDEKNMIFASNNKDFVGKLSAKRLIELYQSGNLEFINA